MTLLVQSLASLLLIAGVFWFLWKLPPARAGVLALTPFLALGSAWAGLLALIATGLLWLVPWPDHWLSMVMLLLDPASIAAGVAVFWAYRHPTVHADTEPIHQQRLQAATGLTLTAIAVVIGYVYVTTHYAGTPVA